MITKMVSIPYSSGEKCKPDRFSGSAPRGASAFQSLIHQGKNARSHRPSRSAAEPPLFQSLIHQGKNARKYRTYIKKIEEKNAVSIPYSSGEKCKRFYRDHRKLTEISKEVSIPYSSGEKCKSRSDKAERLYLNNVSIPYSSGEKCKLRRIPLTRVYYCWDVSIPYSSGEKCKRQCGGEMGVERWSDGFQSLIHQGKNARISLYHHRCLEG